MERRATAVKRGFAKESQRDEGKEKKNDQVIWFVLDRKPGDVRLTRWHIASKRVEISMK